VTELSAAAPRLSFARKVGFTAGDFACNLYWQSVSLFLLFYYTDALGLSAGTAGLIYMLASIWDGAIDPFMGAIADRTRSRWGRYRPYILLGAVPVGLSFSFLYYRPALDGLGLVAVVMAAHFLFRTCYTALSIPYTSLNARLTPSSGERSTLAGMRIIFATLAGLVVALTTQPMVARFGGGDQARGFFYAACVLALIATAIFPIVFAVTREPPETEETVAPPRMADYWRSLRGNRAFWAVMGGIVCAVACTTALGKSVLYYFKYYLHDEAASRTALALCAALGLLIVPAWLLVTKFIGKRMAWFVAAGWGLAGLGAFAVTDIRSPALMIAFLAYMQVASLGLALTFWSMLPDTVEYGEWRTGFRAESFIFGLGQFFLKVALGLGAGLFGWSLDLVGYRPNVEQTAATLHGMKTIMVVFPALGLLACAVVMLFYPLGRGVHEDIVEQLARRRSTPPENAAIEAAI
jgi:GPH family glycoside/pentoside/hexuronide:cation symporter